MGSKNSYRGEDLEDDLLHVWLHGYVDIHADTGVHQTPEGGRPNQHPKMRLLEAYLLMSEDQSAHTSDVDIYINGAKAGDSSPGSGQAIGTRVDVTLVNAETLLERDELVTVLSTTGSATSGQCTVYMHFVVVE